MMWGDGWGGWGWVFGALMMLLFWGGLVALVIFAIRGWGGRQEEKPGQPRAQDAKAILEERFARGEISKEEFEERAAVLDRHAM